MVCADAAAIWIVLTRACCPVEMRRREIGRPRALANRRRQASLARPSTGGAVTLPFINSLMGTASRGGAEKPDLLMTTQTIWDAVWARVQPQQRYPNPSQQDIANVGFDVININGAALVSDNKCPSGYLFGLNTNYIEFYVGQGYDFYVRGPFPLQVQDGFTAQILMYCELAIQAPGLMFNASGLTA